MVSQGLDVCPSSRIREMPSCAWSACQMAFDLAASRLCTSSYPSQWALAALMCKGEQTAWNFTHPVVDSFIAGHRFARCLGKLPHLPANGPDRQRRSLERQPQDAHPLLDSRRSPGLSFDMARTQNSIDRFVHHQDLATFYIRESLVYPTRPPDFQFVCMVEPS